MSKIFCLEVKMEYEYDQHSLERLTTLMDQLIVYETINKELLQYINSKNNDVRGGATYYSSQIGNIQQIIGSLIYERESHILNANDLPLIVKKIIDTTIDQKIK